MLHIRSAEVRYGDHIAFSDFSLDIEPGGMVSIIGRSGCGKTSLLYAIAGLRELSNGTIEGVQECSIMFQQDRLLPWKRAVDNVLLGLDESMRPQAEKLLKLVGLELKSNRYPRQLSGGERQRVALARCLIRNPRLLLLDEPFAALDEQTRERLQEEVKQFVLERGITLILVTHSISEAVFMGERIVVMTKNGILAQTTNAWNREKDLRFRSEAFELQQMLRRQLEGVR